MKSESTRVLVLLCSPGDETVTDVARRTFMRALKTFEAVIPDLDVPRPGVCVARARGPVRFYGSESSAAQALMGAAHEVGYLSARIGIAESRFVAEQAARASATTVGVTAAAQYIHSVRTDETPHFLATLPLTAAGARYAEVIDLLAQLGVHTCGALAELNAEAVAQRFGALGIDLHRLAGGHEPRQAPPSEVLTQDEFSRRFSFDAPLSNAEQLAFASRSHASAFVQELAAQGLVCTEIAIELIDDTQTVHARVWAQPSHFTDFDIVNRVRWQSAGLTIEPERTEAGILTVVLTTARVAHATAHEPGLWNTASDQRIHHHLARLQHLLGHNGVCTAELTGGHLSADRRRLLPWGHSEREGASPVAGPWPGHLTGMPPSMVFTDPPEVSLLDREHHPVTVTPDQTLNAAPAFFDTNPTASPTSRRSQQRSIDAWSALWPLTERWWSVSPRTSYRLQIVADTGEAWLLRYEQPPQRTPSSWVAEGRYD